MQPNTNDYGCRIGAHRRRIHGATGIHQDVCRHGPGRGAGCVCRNRSGINGDAGSTGPGSPQEHPDARRRRLSLRRWRKRRRDHRQDESGVQPAAGRPASHGAGAFGRGWHVGCRRTEADARQLRRGWRRVRGDQDGLGVHHAAAWTGARSAARCHPGQHQESRAGWRQGHHLSLDADPHTTERRAPRAADRRTSPSSWSPTGRTCQSAEPDV